MGTPCHWHCTALIEHTHDMRRWADPTEQRSDTVRWQYPQVTEWTRDQLVSYRDQASERYQWDIDQRLDVWKPAATGNVEQYDPGNMFTAESWPWQYLAHRLRNGAWMLQVWHLDPVRQLVLWMLAYADNEAPGAAPQSGRGQHVVCQQHQRPAELPYPGLSPRMADHARAYGHLV